MDTKRSFKCEECCKIFSEQRYMNEHLSAVHKGWRYNCPLCYNTYSHERRLKTHIRDKHPNLFECICCDTTFTSIESLLSKEHINRCLLIKPLEAVHTMDQEEPGSSNDDLIKEELDNPEVDDFPVELHDTVQNYWRLIRTQQSTVNLLDHVYNYRWGRVNGNFLMMLSDIYLKEKQCFRINGAIGCVLKNRETGESKYWYACQNNFMLLEKPQLIKNSDDVNNVASTLQHLDMTEMFTRPNTKWNLAAVTNVEFYVMPQLNFVAGCRNHVLPAQIAHQRHNIIGMTQDSKHTRFNDNLCFFRCLAQCFTTNYENKELILNYFQQYCVAKRIHLAVDLFDGVSFEEIPKLENLFNVDIQIYYTNEEGNATCWKNVVRRHEHFMNLDISFNEQGKAHFSCINNLDQYAKRYGCIECGRLFKNASNLKAHINGFCHNGQTRHRFVGGVYHVKQTVFEQLETLDIITPCHLKYCPYIAVYDFESLLIKEQNKVSDKLLYVTEHKPISCAVATNMPGYEQPICIINNDPDILVSKLLEHLCLISSRQQEILLAQFEMIFHEIDSLMEKCEQEVANLKKIGKDIRREKGHLNFINAVKNRLLNYCRQLTCIGFNSGKYDLNLIKRNLFPKMVHEARSNDLIKWPKAILRNGSYLCLSTNSLKFLDASVYAAPGFSLDTFMRAYKAKLTKAHFPYEYLDSFEKLYEQQLPAKEYFYSSLRKESISPDAYDQCRKLWEENGMQTMFDYLRFYNLRDVEPFLEACLNMAQIYWSNFKIDVFREALSLPGVTERYLFNSIPGVHFALFNEKTKELHYKLKASMRGGLAMVMNRLAIKDTTFIRNNPEQIVKRIIGLDFNALYLWAQSMPTPVGHFDHWIMDQGVFKKNVSSKSISIEWLEQESQKCGYQIQHLGNNREKCIGPRHLPVDGFCQPTNTVYEFYGCYWHNHNCPAGWRNKGSDVNKVRQWIIEKENYIQSLGYNLITIWECQWKINRRSYLSQNQDLFRAFYSSKFIKYEQMESSILNGRVFGFARVDISTPDHLKRGYADFPPIIKHAKVGIDDIGTHMKEYALRTGQLSKPRDCLISSYFGQDIFLSTPMICFLVQHGLILDKIYEVVQYDESRPFQNFRDVVTMHRRNGDADPELSILADTYKLLGNTGYGKTLTNKEKHVDVFYCDLEKAIECSYSPYVKKIKSISGNCFEVQMRKTEIKLDLPIVIGLSVYNWAKIKMLEFFYDILQVYFNQSMYQCMETDTDSIYLALSTETLLEAVKPELKNKFLTEIYPKWFVTRDEDKRTPGLLKVEWQGTAMCCLSAKTYVGIGDYEKKISCKGIMKKINDLTFDTYQRVLTTKTPWNGQNIGFRIQDDNKIWTYMQEKQGLPYLYIKRKVLDDGITTVPLDL